MASYVEYSSERETVTTSYTKTLPFLVSRGLTVRFSQNAMEFAS